MNDNNLVGRRRLSYNPHDNTSNFSISSEMTSAAAKHDVQSETSSFTVIACDDNNLNGKNKKVCLFKKWYRAIMGDIYATDDPKQGLSQTRKNIIIAVAAISGLSGPIGIMINLPGVLQMTQELHTSVAGMNGTVSACIIMMGLAASLFYSNFFFYCKNLYKIN